ncbi:lactococcin 972 family bacteriocin [Streptomyces sp. NPDC002209]|uniref:lactococcin 972 family bacteriocin n=1 Tax=Streptomyces sp. NPDC002209 TaxID=3364638 RepID=UPI0036C55C38
MQIKRAFRIALTTGTLVAAAATPALAANVSGGLWDYGVTDSVVYSNYLHKDKCHGSSVQGSFFSSSGDVDAGDWSYASAGKAWSGNKSYYRSTC